MVKPSPSLQPKLEASGPAQQEVVPEAHSVSIRLPESIGLEPSDPLTAPSTFSTITGIAGTTGGASFTVLATATPPQSQGTDPSISSPGPEVTGFEPQQSGGSIAAATIGAISAVAAIIVLVYFIMLRRKRSSRNSIGGPWPEMQIGRSNSARSEQTFRNGITIQSNQQFNESAAPGSSHHHIEQDNSAARISWSSDSTPTGTLVPSIISEHESSQFSEATTAGSRQRAQDTAEHPLASRIPSGLIRLNTWLQENRRRSRVMGSG
jgi:hypothetical protein